MLTLMILAAGAGCHQDRARVVVAGSSRVVFWGLETEGQTVAYVVDGCGSAFPFAEAIREKLIASIDALDDRQKFTVIFYSDNRAIPWLHNSQAYHLASAQMKSEAADWVRSYVPGSERGTSAPEAGIASAVAADTVPDVICLLSTGGMNDETVRQGTKLARQHGFKVLSVLAVSDVPEAAARRLAAETGGAYLFVHASDLADYEGIVQK